MKLTNEMKIGVLVAVVAVLLAFLTWKAGNFKVMVGGYAIKVRFQNIEGVETNAPVRLNGLEVGRVQEIDILYEAVPKVEVTLWIQGDVQVPKGVKAYVKNMGFMGEKYIGLYAENVDGGYLSQGETISGHEPASLEEMMQDGQEIAENMREISKEIRLRLQANSQTIDEILANMRITMNNAASISGNLNERLAANKHLVDDTIVRVNSLSRNFEEMSYDLKMNPWKLLYRPKTKAVPAPAK
ncbi:MAG: MlaD family protein [Candidatus Omnitrophota bacterium]|nr:MlaD family protein [Candidatus Omnitrophota bacterium]MDZ4242736.1 MlaD family protein [Candidatus Omnitrophota bacterium]